MNYQYPIAFAAIVLMWLFLSLGHVELSLITISAGIVFLLWQNIGTIKYNFTKKISGVSVISTPKIETFENPLQGVLVNKISKYSVVAYFSNFLEELFRTNLKTSGKFANPTLVGKKSGSLFILSLITAIGLTLVGLLSGIVFLAVTLLIPALLLFYPIIQLKGASSERKARIDDEIAYFVSFASAMQSVGKNLQNSFLDIVGSHVFPQLEHESNTLHRNISLFSEDPMIAINKLGLHHPNENLSELLLGYVAISKSGGDSTNFLKDKAHDFFNYTVARLNRYSELAAEIGSAMIILLTMLPVLLMVSAFLMDSEAVQFMSTISFLMLPLITMGIVGIAHSIQPKNLDRAKFQIYSFPIGIVTGILVYLITSSPALASIFGIMFLAGSNYVLNKKRLNEISSTDKHIGSFLRDLTEAVKTDSPINVGLSNIVKSRKYDFHFDKLLRKISLNLHSGNSLSSATSSSIISSHLGRMTFFVLGKLMDAGGANAEVMENLTGFVNKIKTERQSVLGKLQLITMLGYFSPILMVFLSISIQNMFDSNFSGVDELLEDSAIPVKILSASPEFLALIDMLTVITSLSIGISVAKLTNFGFANTMPLLIVSVITLVAIISMPFIQPYL
jgi:hypothetical protein